MKRALSMILTAAMAVLLFSGCGKQDTDADNGISTITIWHDKEDAVTEVLQKKLEILEPQIHVVLEKKSDLTEALKMVGNNPKAAPDMYFFAHDKIGVYAEMDILAPITDIVPEQELADTYMENTLEAASYKKTVYQLPIYYETLLFIYNRLYMSDEEVPKTTEELYSYMQETTRGGHYGFVEQHSTPYYVSGWINGFGGSILSETGMPGLDSPETIAALEYHKKFVELMPGETEYATVNTLLAEGMAHATIAGPWMIPTVRERGMDAGVAAMPVIEETGRPISPYMGVQGIQVLKHAAQNKKEAVEKVLRQVMDAELGAELAGASGCAPANKACYDMEAVTSDEVVMAMKETAEHAVPMPNLPEMDVMWTVAGNLLTDINMSGKDVTESAAKAQKEAERLIESMR
ncbi:extracellular solute-binding protein [Kineothrix sp. MB12-C1]|uniref:extracellular solute-binding protein n=1 Tax=Kineothrix sp. MB12-C1 TaxID=3070215 RepID=UPI0027D2DA63|nr:extracellular solute-binding protein [Kineothrix sp. MB12-C1]WMC94083.1 extracellular solute-binding protein [Kineothrix sp. MB12-C1]